MFDVLMCQSIDGKEAWQQRQSDEKKKKWFFYVCAKTKTVPSFKLFYVAWFAFFFRVLTFSYLQLIFIISSLAAASLLAETTW